MLILLSYFLGGVKMIESDGFIKCLKAITTHEVIQISKLSGEIGSVEIRLTDYVCDEKYTSVLHIREHKLNDFSLLDVLIALRNNIRAYRNR